MPEGGKKKIAGMPIEYATIAAGVLAALLWYLHARKSSAAASTAAASNPAVTNVPAATANGQLTDQFGNPIVDANGQPVYGPAPTEGNTLIVPVDQGLSDNQIQLLLKGQSTQTTDITKALSSQTKTIDSELSKLGVSITDIVKLQKQANKTDAEILAAIKSYNTKHKADRPVSKAPPPPPSGTTMTVCPWPAWCGSLWGIAGHYYGNGADWPRIWSANSQIKDPNLIYPGQRLFIPGA